MTKDEFDSNIDELREILCSWTDTFNTSEVSSDQDYQEVFNTTCKHIIEDVSGVLEDHGDVVILAE